MKKNTQIKFKEILSIKTKMGLTEMPAGYMTQNSGNGHVMVMDHHHHHHLHVQHVDSHHHQEKDKMSSKKKMHLLKKIKKRFGLG